MAFTVRDFESLVRLLDRHPEWLEALRQRLLTRELVRAPEMLRELEGTLRALLETVAALAEAQRRTQEEVAAARAEADRRFAELAEAQRRTEERVGRLEEALAALAEAQRRHYEEFVAHRAETDRRLAALQEEVAVARAEADRRFAELAEAQRRTEERVGRLEEVVAGLIEAQRRTEEQVRALAEAQQRTEERVARLEEAVAALAEAQRRTEEQVRALTEAMRTLIQDVAVLKDHDLKRRYVERAAAYFGGPDFRKVRPLSPTEVLEALERALDAGEISPQAFVDAQEADGVIRGQREGRTIHVVLEASWVVDRGDVERAVRRAEILGKALGEAWPAVAGRRLTEGAREAIRQLREEGRPIVVIQDGRVEWPV